MSKRSIVITAFVAVGLVTSLGYTSIAQSPIPSPSPSPEATPTPSPTSGSSQSSLSQFDREFMVHAAQGGMAEGQFGQIAIARASSNTVRQYAQRMIQEHTKANNELKALAKG